MADAPKQIPGTRESTAGGIFINYRSSDERTLAVTMLRARLVQHFGPDRVFMDEQMHPGVRYPDEIRERLDDSNVLLAMIHKGWLEDVDENGQRLIDRERDWVREEIASALRAGKHVFQVLLGNAARPAPECVPAEIRELTTRQDFRLTTDRDVDRLMLSLERYAAPAWQPGSPPAERAPRWLRVFWALALLYPPLILISFGWGRPSIAKGLGITLTGLVFLGTASAAGQLVLWTGTHLWRRRIHAWETTPTLDRPLLRRVFSPIPVMVLFAPVLVGWNQVRDSTLPAPAFLGGLTVLAYMLTSWILRERDRERREDTAWPLPGSRSAPTALSLHNDLGRLRARLETWRRPLSREQRDKSRWALGRLGETAEELRRQAGLTRRGRLTSRSEWNSPALVLLGYGLIGLAALPGLWIVALSQSSHPLRATMILLPVSCVFVGMAVGSLELRHRRERWKATTLAAEVEAEVTRLRELLDHR